MFNYIIDIAYNNETNQQLMLFG